MGTRITPYSAPESEAKRHQVARMFDNIAEKYDFLNHLFSFGIDVLWRKKALRHLERRLQSNSSDGQIRLMDMATGTADFAIEAVRSGQLSYHVTGVDISPGMLEVGRRKIEKRGWQEQIQLMEGDSVQLPFETGTFDAYTVAFGVRNFEDLHGGLTEMHRVLKPGGWGAVLEFSKPRKFPMKQLFRFYFHTIMPTIGRWVSKDSSAYTYLPESVAAFPEGKGFLDEMAACGYTQFDALPLTGGIATIYYGQKPIQS